ncbi:MAG: 16S rRNA (uracil(1498)-N(3))-methyltransferase [Lachnospiraceae bacterium]|nr:16S rRNA (uracil(1498)-N(3))-methyltransferase [Lachnospiraceae bacterium]
MNHFFVEASQIQGKQVRILGEDVKHIRNVLRMKPGEELSVSNGIDDKEYRCGIVSISEDEVLCELRFVKEAGVELPLRLRLFQGLPKSDKMDLIVQKAVELGAAEIIPVACERCVVQLDKGKYEKKRERWQNIARSAAEQSRRAYIPQLGDCLSMKEAVAAAAEDELALIPYEMEEGMSGLAGAMQKIRELALSKAGASVSVFIGPEGGFAESEVAAAREAGIVPVSLGRRILRTETAGFCLLSHIMLMLESEVG